jgi:hypothetical protein
LDEKHVFRKTELGAGELSSRWSVLSHKHRRCLILIDGRKTARELAACFRPGEFVPVVRDLVERGYIEPPPGGPAALESPPGGDFPFIDEARFREIQQRAVREVTDRLGPAGDALTVTIARCETPEQLRVALRTVERVLEGFLGGEYAKAFVKRTGKDLMGS